ncbi:uncharacterized protein A4U43_C05F24940 [Asparagus officinalis]|uniref:Uncharacterized protein n=1 Tax=Asparagus officinalis TaxID=4686 RepID=A0A5P1EVP7_ASPOF|nr:uncharacterized protein A4U43_C05F24940 [Asparagus officinalis]
MGIEEIKSRQRRLSPTAADVTEVNGVCGSRGGKGAWRVIQSLSCKGSESAVDVSVTVPLRTLSCSGSA